MKQVSNIHITQNLYVKQEYNNHPVISGNKYRKLNYNLIEAKKQGYKTLLTFGGAYSNHISAVALAGPVFDFKTIGIIRGEELATKIDNNHTLKKAAEEGMQLKFITREAFRNKTQPLFLEELQLEFGPFYLLPEGGTNALAVKGCEEILTPDDAVYDVICCPVGTGGTMAGIINSSFPHQKIFGFSALKGDFLKPDIAKFAQRDNWELISDYHFGGYAKINHELISFINQFKDHYDIPLDPVYTGKMLYGLFDMIKRNQIAANAKILAIHTGGLQGICGMNERLKKMKLPLIQT